MQWPEAKIVLGLQGLPCFGVSLHGSALHVSGETAQPAWTVPLCPRGVMQRLTWAPHTWEQVQGVRCGGWTSTRSPRSRGCLGDIPVG